MLQSARSENIIIKYRQQSQHVNQLLVQLKKLDDACTDALDKIKAKSQILDDLRANSLMLQESAVYEHKNRIQIQQNTSGAFLLFFSLLFNAVLIVFIAFRVLDLAVVKNYFLM
ncbi:Hypothetical_protein [Hexamita inflata]|uniref:Hypothetical_protein n=1 Tax=Hexamita inflata TaxID=28002 RepID=A0AA86NW83_9EUKA|nr:Hypothetical protein HINF_LOCUS14644 [Hexamita inflata]